MSRIANKIISIPEGVTVTINPDNVVIKGKTEQDVVSYDPTIISLDLQENVLKVLRKNEEKHTKQLHGTTRALINNAIVGVSKGFTKELEIIGIGYNAQLKGKDLVLHVGYSHPIVITPLDGVTITLKDPTHVTVTGSSKFKVGQVAALIRASRKPEPYQGKGIKYKEEVILRKEGKRAGSK